MVDIPPIHGDDLGMVDCFFDHIHIHIIANFLQIPTFRGKTMARTALPIQSVAEILKSDLDQGTGDRTGWAYLKRGTRSTAPKKATRSWENTCFQAAEI